MNLEDHFKLLGVGEKSTLREITVKYREKAKKTHPDKRRDDPKATEKFQRLQATYEYLKKWFKRKPSTEEIERKKREEEERMRKKREEEKRAAEVRIGNEENHLKWSFY